MAPPSTARRRTHAELEDDDSDSTISSDATDSPKRPRLGSFINGEPPIRMNGGNFNGAVNGPAAASFSPDDFAPGAIVRVTVENFVTYEKAEFFPGPNLNMVIGPNGTGKSSLVCAICLGLGFHHRLLARASSARDFVKHNKDEATIEIELRKRPKDRSNHVIRVLIPKGGDSQKWWLNGKETSQKNIQNLMRQLKIQVDNICQFLPQERVVEFASCTPINLLHETLRAAAPEEMLEWQSQLQGLHKDKKELGAGAQADADTLRNLENRQQGLQADVDRIREREEIQTNIENLKGAHLMCRYQEAREKNKAAKQQRDAAKASLRSLEEESGPSLEAVYEKEKYARRVGDMLPAKMRAVKDAEKDAQRLASLANDASEKVKECQNNIAAEHKGYDAKKKELSMARTKVTNLQADLKNQPAEFNGADWNQKIRGEEHKKRELESDKRQVETKLRNIKERGKNLNVEIERVKEDIKAFDTQQGQQLSYMKKQFPELATGWEWIEANQDQFEKPVFGPPMVSCSIKDERYSDQVQGLLQNDDFTCFTAQTRNDYKKLSDQLYRVMSLSVVIRTCSSPLESYRSPISPEAARQLGLDGFAIDYLDGPAPVLAMLCAERGLQRSGVSLNEHTDAQYENLVQSGTVTQWAAGKQSYIVRRRREYGPQAMTTVTKNIQRGRYWTSQTVDTQEKTELERRLQELRDDWHQAKPEHNEMAKRLTDINAEIEELENSIDQLKQDKNSLQKEYQKWQSLPEKIETEERKTAECEASMRAIKKGIVDLQFNWDKAAISRARLALKHAEAVDKIAQAHNDLLETRIWHIEAESDIDGLKQRNASIMERVEAERRIATEASALFEETKKRGRELQQEVNDKMGAMTDEWREMVVTLCDGKSSDEVQMEMEAEEAKLELIHAANPNVIREFERRAGEIERLKRKMETSQEKLQRLTQETEELMTKWEPRVDELVARINDAFAYNFEQISCAGEVRVHKDDDFDQWALDIMVKFRENEELQQLNAQRQSGGERAVSTIFYLMALQSMAQSPFRVVDEINQGMDPRNERMVHERMVEIACREHTSQYFLITPKLLMGLRYDPKMRVLCIASGEHMPQEGRKLDFRRCLKIQKGLMAGV